MSEVNASRALPPHRATAPLWAALVTGVTADLLLRIEPWGVNIALFGVGLGAFLLLLQLAGRIDLQRPAGSLVGIAIGCLSSFILRDSPILNLLALGAAGSALSLAAFSMQGGSLRTDGTLAYVAALIRNGIGTAVGILPLCLQDISFRSRDDTRHQRWASVARGLLLALPPLVLFAALFASADPIFGSLFAFDLELVVTHGIVIGVGVWLGAGYGRELLLGRPVIPMFSAAPARSRWGFTETTILIGAINALFLTFVIVQLRVLFGGDAFVEAHTGLTYAEYARRGFFDLVTVSALALPLLLVADWCGRRSGPREETTFRALSHLLLLLLFAILLSAVQRMRIYQLSYGLTELRVYTMAFMAWLGLVFLWFGGTVLRGRRGEFAPGAAVLALLVLIALHLVNPDQLIVRTNLERAYQGRPFDAPYAASLSGDAVPELVGGLKSLPPDAGCRVLGNLVLRSKSRAKGDWRTWNLSRRRAMRLIQGEVARDRGMASRCEAEAKAARKID